MNYGNENKTPDGKVACICGIVAGAFEIFNLVLMVFINKDYTYSQLLMSGLILALSVYWAVTGRKKWLESLEKMREDED